MILQPIVIDQPDEEPTQRFKYRESKPYDQQIK